MGCEHKTEYPFEIREVDPQESEEMLNYFSSSITKFIRLGPSRYLYYKEFDKMALDVYNMKPRPTDTFVVTFPRSGTTWTQELVWLLQNDLDFKTARATPLVARFPFIEGGALLKLNYPEEIIRNDSFDKFKHEVFFIDPSNIDTLPSPRCIKTHMPLSLLPPTLLDTAKVVYVARDPRDVAVSIFHHMKSLRTIPNDRKFKPFWKFFMENKVFRSPYFEHLKEAWRQRNNPNLTFIFYEELTKDLPGVARRLAKFFGKEYSDEQFMALCDHLKFDNFKNNESVNLAEWKKNGILTEAFIRKGKVGGWREHFDEEMTEQAERWIEDNLRDTDLRFPVVQEAQGARG